MIDPAVEFAGVTKRYKYFTLDHIDLKLPTGYIMGFVGANGAGKSTTLRILMGLVHQDSGSVKVLGHAMPAGSGHGQAGHRVCIGRHAPLRRSHARVAYAFRAVDLPALGQWIRQRPSSPLRSEGPAEDQRDVSWTAGESRSDARARAQTSAAGARRADDRPRPNCAPGSVRRVNGSAGG